MEDTGLTTYLETALQFIAAAKNASDKKARELSAARVIAKAFEKDIPSVQKALHHILAASPSITEYRVSASVVDSIEHKGATVASDEHVSTGARVRIGDTMYDRSADTIINSIISSLTSN